MLAWLRVVNLAVAVLATLAPVAHVLEMPNKLSLSAGLWFAVQTRLYRGWGPFLGGPAEVGALATTVWLAYLRRRRGSVFWLTLIACISYSGMLAAFFTLDSPVNVAVASWTPPTIPSDWMTYRLRWEIGHAVAAVFSAIGLAALLCACRPQEPSCR